MFRRVSIAGLVLLVAFVSMQSRRTSAASMTVPVEAGTGAPAGARSFAPSAALVPPVANAGPDAAVPAAMENQGHITLDGTGSFDPDGTTLTYSWTLDGTEIANQAKQTVMLMTGVHIITLTVTDVDGLQDTDDVQVEITPGPSNPDPFFCPDINGDVIVNSGDQLTVLQAFGKRFGQSGYTRLKDFNVDRVINSGDMLGLAKWFGQQCSVEDQMIRAATLAIEPYQDINAAIAAGFVQATQFVPQQGRHMVKSSLYDTTFDPVQPEGLLYEPDPSTPGGWRLGGALYVMPIPLNPLLPDGFPGTDDTWHFHDFLCFYPAPGGGQYVTLDPEPVCTANGGSYQTNVGWLLHLWTYVPAPYGAGRYVADNPNFMGLR